MEGKSSAWSAWVALPEDIYDEANLASPISTTNKDQQRYQKEYEHLISWRKSKEAYGVNEEILLAFGQICLLNLLQIFCRVKYVKNKITK